MPPGPASSARIAIVLIALVVSLAILREGIASGISRSDPALAARIAAGDARIAMAAARDLIDRGAQARDPAVSALTEATLRRDATLTPAIELRALQVEAAGNKAREARLFALSNAISRRSLATRLWLIQRAVDRGDVTGALRDFDIALRTSAAAPAILFPVLAGATTDPGLATPLARLLDRPEEWRLLFLNYAIDKGGAGADLARVLLRMHDRAFITGNGIDHRLIERLVSERAFRPARMVHDAFSSGSGADAEVVDRTFADPAAGYPFGWTLTDKGELTAQRDLVDGRHALAYQAMPGRSGQVAAQLLTLRPGAYRLSTRTARTGDPDARPYWSLTCAEQGGAPIASLDQPGGDGKAAARDFDVRDGCGAQWLVLSLRGSGQSGGQAGAIAAIAVRAQPPGSRKN